MVRVIGKHDRDLCPKLTQEWNLAGITRLMTQGLSKAGKTVPDWFALFAKECADRTRPIETAIFGMS